MKKGPILLLGIIGLALGTFLVFFGLLQLVGVQHHLAFQMASTIALVAYVITVLAIFYKRD